MPRDFTRVWISVRDLDVPTILTVFGSVIADMWACGDLARTQQLKSYYVNTHIREVTYDLLALSLVLKADDYGGSALDVFVVSKLAISP